MKVSKEALQVLTRALISEAERGVTSYYFPPPAMQPQYPQPAVQQNPYGTETLDYELGRLEATRKRSSALEEACEFVLQAAGYPGE